MNIFPDIKLYKNCINLQSIERLILYLLFVLTDDFYGFGTIYSNKHQVLLITNGWTIDLEYFHSSLYYLEPSQHLSEKISWFSRLYFYL